MIFSDVLDDLHEHLWGHPSRPCVVGVKFRSIEYIQSSTGDIFWWSTEYIQLLLPRLHPKDLCQDSVTLFRKTNQFFIDAIIRSSFARAPNFVTVNRKLCFVFWIQRICDLEMWDWDSQFVNDTALSFAILHLYYLSSSCLGEILVTITQSVGFGFPAGYIAWSKSAATLSIDWKFQHLTIPGTIAIFL